MAQKEFNIIIKIWDCWFNINTIDNISGFMVCEINDQLWLLQHSYNE